MRSTVLHARQDSTRRSQPSHVESVAQGGSVTPLIAVAGQNAQLVLLEDTATHQEYRVNRAKSGAIRTAQARRAALSVALASIAQLAQARPKAPFVSHAMPGSTVQVLVKRAAVFALLAALAMSPTP